MKTEEETSALPARIADARMKRQNDAEDQLGQLLDATDVFIYHAQNWLERKIETVPPVREALADPQLARSHSLLVLSNAALQGLFTIAESYRAGIFHLSGWIERKMLEARSNAGFIAYETTGLAGQRWLLYGLYRLAALEGDEESERNLTSELKIRFPDDHPWRENQWAKTVDQDGKQKVLSNLTDRSDYVEKIWPVPTALPDNGHQIRRRNHKYELKMIRMDNLVVHPTVTGDQTGPNPIRALYSAIQMAWDILTAFSETDDLSLTAEMKCAHERFVDTMIGVLAKASISE